MKIKNVALLLVWIMAVMVWFWYVSAKELKMDLDNIRQHMTKVKIINNSNVNSYSILKLAGAKLIWIETNNFVISKMWSDINKVNAGSINSDILWWVENQVKWFYSSILWWESNNIVQWNYSTILWWKSNKIGEDRESSYSTIVWWTQNTVNWNNSTIVWWTQNTVNWNNSAVLWNNSQVNWFNSVALWNNTINNADNSFLWTDNQHNEPLPSTVNNVFVVNSTNWMVVNANKPHSLAQLTIGWPLVIDSWNDVACDNSHVWVVKVVDGDVIQDGENNHYKCFCSCDWLGYWHSLYGQWRCEWYCNWPEEHVASCTDSADPSAQPRYAVCGDRFVWSCGENSKPVTWEWAYFVDRNGAVHWTCQTDAGLIESCSSSLNDNTLCD